MKPRPPCETCEGTEDVREYWPPYKTKHPTYQCDNCAESAWQSHQEDYNAPSARERLELDHRTKRETR